MISPAPKEKIPEEKIYSPESKTPTNPKNNVPAEFEYVEPKKTESTYMIIAGGAIAICVIVSVAITVMFTVNGGRLVNL